MSGNCIYKYRAKVWLVALMLLVSIHGQGQRPCRDTMVYLYDSVCEGDTFDFNGRLLTYTGLFFDTVQRVGSDCDSVIILRLTVLIIPSASIYPYRRCEGNVGYDLYSSGMGTYYRWSSYPVDTSLVGQDHNSWVHVNPKQPITYYLYVDYRETPQCPDTGSKLVNPIAPVSANMSLKPDELTLDHMEFTVEDFSTGTREYQWGGWCGRHWNVNGVRQKENNECVTFSAEPWWPDTVEVMMLAYTPTCLDSVTKKIPFKKISLYFPNVFTPGRESNALFAPRLLGIIDFEMWIYDRHGVLIFHTQSADDPWDGTYQGALCPTGSYVYRCRYSDISTPNGSQSLTGTVTLLR